MSACMPLELVSVNSSTGSPTRVLPKVWLLDPLFSEVHEAIISTHSKTTLSDAIRRFYQVSRLRSVENEKEHRNRETRQQVDQRSEQSHSRNHVSHDTQDRIDEISGHENCQQHHPDECQKRRILEAHGGVLLMIKSIVRPQNWLFARTGSVFTAIDKLQK